MDPTSLLVARRKMKTQTNEMPSIETDPTPENISKCNQQSQSPLFRMLPPEIRNNIFSLALLQYEDLTQPYPEHDFCYRPGHRARRIVSTGLLLTCRRVWLEANHWPMEQTVHSFWFDRRPSWTATHHSEDYSRFLAFVNGLTPLQKSRIKYIEVSAQICWLKQFAGVSRLLKHSGYDLFSLNTFTVTMRHGDEWFLNHHLSTYWVRKLFQPAQGTSISELRLEMEVLEWRAGELRPILDSLRSITQPGEAESKHWELIEPFEKSFWSGPTNLGGKDHAIYADREKLDYRITTMKWRRRSPAAEEIA